MQRESALTVRKHPRLGIRPALALALALTAASTMLGVAGLLGHQLCRSVRHAERLRVLAMAEVYAAQVAAVGGPTDLQTLVDALSWHPGSRLLAVLDEDGGLVALRGDRALLDQIHKPANVATPADGKASCVLSGDRELLLPDIAAATAPIIISGESRPAGTLVYAARTSGWHSSPGAGLWKYLSAVLAIAGAGVIMGLCLLRHSVLDPLKSLIKAGRGEEMPALSPDDPSDEIGVLAKLMQDMAGGLDKWREQMAGLESYVERRVESETHQVTLKLRQVERKAWMDPLTKLGNRRLLEDKFERLFDETREAGGDLAVAMIDLDYFKTLNDTLGHKAGDELLAFIGDLLRQAVREVDLAIRYGGDEFLLVFPGVSSAVAVAAAERITRLLNQRARLLPVEPKPGMSVGVASMREHRPATPAAFLHMADLALYSAKSLGRSRVCVYLAQNEPVRTAPARC